ncbi:MAG: hypothetical protein JWN53_1603, partial [Gemmatimonadetes bacterium]|nr:hypothetical protein [Gemmatimonadota bacterium]
MHDEPVTRREFAKSAVGAVVALSSVAGLVEAC